jgi:hypothetical protein
VDWSAVFVTYVMRGDSVLFGRVQIRAGRRAEIAGPQAYFTNRIALREHKFSIVRAGRSVYRRNCTVVTGGAGRIPNNCVCTSRVTTHAEGSPMVTPMAASGVTSRAIPNEPGPISEQLEPLAESQVEHPLLVAMPVIEPAPPAYGKIEA